MSEYKPVIGIEVHVEVKTNTKLFSNSLNSYGSLANSLINEVDLGYPGTLPTVNEEVIKQAIKACHVLNCSIRKKMHFDRKNYFYPDNSKNYQITQSRTPIGYDGYLEINDNGKTKKIFIEEMHIEEDTCKSVHRKDKTLLDFNRSGIPLIEIVTKPCISNSKEAKLYLEKLKEVLLYANVSDCKMEEGSLRADANVSISKNDKLGTKIEIKNIGSITNVGLAIDKEIKRQEKLLDKGIKLKEETRRYDDKIGDTILMRVKETGNDYRYFPDADIPFIELTDNYINDIINSIPKLPDELRIIYKDLGLNDININKLLLNRDLNNFFLNLIDKKTNHQKCANLLLGDISYYLNKNDITLNDTTLSTNRLIEVVDYLDKGILINKNIKDILDKILETDKLISDIIKEENINNNDNVEEIKLIIKEIINNNLNAVEDYKNGHDRAIKYFMGQIMKQTKGKINPEIANKLLIEELLIFIS